MKKYNVQITEEALKDMEEIYNYISDKLCAPQAALNQYNRIADAILTLDYFPERNAILQSRYEYYKSIRRMVVGKYSVFYVINGDNVITFCVLYSASDIGARLRQREI